MKNMKKIFSVLLTVALLLSAVCFPAAAVEDEAFRFVATATVNDGGASVTVTVAVQNNPGFNGAKLKIGYNSDIFSIVDLAVEPVVQNRPDQNPELGICHLLGCGEYLGK